jgi:hypothetical protein
MVMTPDGLADSIPNGFHDAELIAVTIDYAKSEARLVLDVWIAEHLDTADEREAYRLAEVNLYGLIFWISEPPDASSSYRKGGGHRIDIGPMETLEKKNLVRLPREFAPPDAPEHAEESIMAKLKIGRQAPFRPVPTLIRVDAPLAGPAGIAALP